MLVARARQHAAITKPQSALFQTTFSNKGLIRIERGRCALSTRNLGTRYTEEPCVSACRRISHLVPVGRHIANTCVMLSHVNRRDSFCRVRGTVIAIRYVTWKSVLSVDEWAREQVDEDTSNP